MAAVDFYCSEQSIPQLTHTIPSPSTSAALPYSSQRHHSISTKLTMDPRRLGIILEQEQRFQPGSYHMHKSVDECERMQLLEAVLQMEAVCPEPRQSDCYHLIVNLLDRYLGYSTPVSGELPVLVCACTMMSMKLRRSTKECLSYRQLRYISSNISEHSIRQAEKKIANQLKWDLNAVTAAEFIEELIPRLVDLVPPEDIDRLTDHAHTIANVCLLYSSFITVPPSLLACACLSEAVSFVAPAQHRKCVERLSSLTGVEQDVLLQHQKNVCDVIEQKIQSTCCQEEESATPTDIVDLERAEIFDFSTSS